MTSPYTLCFFCVTAFTLAFAFNTHAQESFTPPPPKVSTVEVDIATTPIERDYPARVLATQSVSLLAQVSGVITERSFEEGAFVEQDALLYVIDPESYQIALDQAEAQVSSARANLSFAQAEVDRFTPLAEENIASPQKLQQLVEQRDSALALVEVAVAGRDAAALALRRTRIKAPLSGRMGLAEADVGDLITASQTPLTTLVQWDPIEVHFRPPARDLFLIEEHHALSSLEVSVFLSKSDDSGDSDTDEMTGHVFAGKGVLDFIDNEVSTSTDTILMRASVDNPDTKLRPGQFARARVHISERESLLVPRKAIRQQQDGYLLYVVDDNDTIQVREVKLDEEFGIQQIILEGVEQGERVVVSDATWLHEGMKVVPHNENGEDAPSQP